jgi:hypothetical protein
LVITSLLAFPHVFVSAVYHSEPRRSSLSPDAAAFFIGQQVSGILKFFLTKNIRIARERAYNQTVLSRGKGTDFWQPYVEEWPAPPRVNASGQKEWSVSRVMSTFVGRVVLKNRAYLPSRPGKHGSDSEAVILVHFAFIPMFGLAVSAWVRGLSTSQFLHRPYFEAKKMTQQQVAIFVEERKWEYRGMAFWPFLRLNSLMET